MNLANFFGPVDRYNFDMRLEGFEKVGIEFRDKRVV